MGTGRLGYRLALPLAGILAVAGFALAPSAQAFHLPDGDRESVQTREVCGDVLFLGARGSGQAAGGAAVDAGTGMGPQVYAAYQRMVTDRPDRTIAPRAVVYPAQEVQAIALDADAYFSGLEQGVRDVKRTLRSEALRCPDQRLVLAGYSQGAMVMHRALQDLSAAQDPAAVDILARLDGALLLADGDRLPKDRTTNYGSAGRSQGISYEVGQQSRARGTRLPKKLANRVQSVCEQADTVCDFHSLFQANAAGVDGVTVHINSYTGTPDVLRATDVVAQRLR